MVDNIPERGLHSQEPDVMFMRPEEPIGEAEDVDGSDLGPMEVALFERRGMGGGGGGGDCCDLEGERVLGSFRTLIDCGLL